MASPKKPKALAKHKGRAKPQPKEKLPPVVLPPTAEEELSALEKQACSEIEKGLEVLREIAAGAGQYEATERVSAAKALIAYGASQIAHVRKIRLVTEKPKDEKKVAQLTLWEFPREGESEFK